MKSLWSKFVMLVGYLTIVCTVYTASFYLVRETLILPHERSSGVKPRGVRPVYNSLFKPLRWFEANGRSLRPKSGKVYFGTLLEPVEKDADEPMSRSLALDLADGGVLSVGFVGGQAVLGQIDALSAGSYLRLDFGVVLSPTSDRFINRLVGVEKIDLMEDPRIARQEYSDEKDDLLLKAFRSLTGEARICAKAFIHDYQSRVFAHCQHAGYAHNIGGGCYHIVGYAIHTAVLEKAMKTCGAESSNSVGQVSETSKTSG